MPRPLPLVFAFFVFVANCSGSTPTPAPTTDVLEIVSPPPTLQPGQEKTFCYYTALRNAAPVGARRFESSMTPGSHHLILFLTREQTRPNGTMVECGFFGTSGGSSRTGIIPVWAYAAQTPEFAADMPEGVGMTLAADQPVIVQMHYLNGGASVLRPQVTIRVRTHTRSDYVPASAFVTYDTSIRVMPRSTGEVSGSCIVPADAKFFLMSTHSHKYTTRAEVMDGERLIVDTADWEHPTVEKWNAEPFYRFESRELKYHCAYRNTTDRIIVTGDSAETDEMCMAVGYFFPATGMRFCIDGFVLPF